MRIPCLLLKLNSPIFHQVNRISSLNYTPTLSTHRTGFSTWEPRTINHIFSWITTIFPINRPNYVASSPWLKIKTATPSRATTCMRTSSYISTIKSQFPSLYAFDGVLQIHLSAISPTECKNQTSRGRFIRSQRSLPIWTLHSDNSPNSSLNDPTQLLSKSEHPHWPVKTFWIKVTSPILHKSVPNHRGLPLNSWLILMPIWLAFGKATTQIKFKAIKILFSFGLLGWD